MVMYANLPPVVASVRVPSLPAYLAPAGAAGADSATETEVFVPTTGTAQSTVGDLALLEGTLAPHTATAGATVTGCRETIRLATLPSGASRVEAVAAGEASPDGRGGTDVPIEARVLYSSKRVFEIHQATITCSVDELGTRDQRRRPRDPPPRERAHHD
jgi:hypothetical protein